MVNKRFVCCILLVWINFVSTQEPEETTVPVLDPFQSGDETTTVDNTFLDESTVSIPEEETTPPLLDEGGFVEDTTIITTSDLLTESTAPTEVSTEELSNELGSMDDVSPAPLLDVDQPAEVFTEAPLAEDSTLDTISTGTAEETFVAVDVTTSPADTESNTTIVLLPVAAPLQPDDNDLGTDDYPDFLDETTTATEPTETTTAFSSDLVPVIDLSDISTTPPTNTTPAVVVLGPVVPAREKSVLATTVSPADEEGGFWYKWGLLVTGILLFILILVAMIYACCCMKERAQSRRQPDVEDNGPDIVPIAKPIHALSKTNQYVDEVITSSSYQYRETRKEPFTAAKREPLAPNNSFATPITPVKGGRITTTDERSPNEKANFELGPKSVENENTKYPLAREVLRQSAKGEAKSIVVLIGTPIDGSPRNPAPDNRASTLPSAGSIPFNYITPRHLDQSYIHNAPNLQPWSRRLEVPPVDDRSISSRDVIAASRVNNAVAAVAAAGSAPLRGATAPKPEADSENEQRVPISERPVLRGGTLERATSPSRPPSYRTTLVFTPQHNRDPNEPVDASPGNTMPYGQYVDMIKGPPSDFAQFSPTRPVTRERRLPDDDGESQV